MSADESPEVMEGAWDRDKVVLMSFPDAAAYRAWADSAEYQEISKDRKAGAQGIVLKPRAKLKDSAEVYNGEEFLGVIYEDEDEDGSFMFEMAILGEDLN